MAGGGSENDREQRTIRHFVLTPLQPPSAAADLRLGKVGGTITTLIAVEFFVELLVEWDAGEHAGDPFSRTAVAVYI